MTKNNNNTNKKKKEAQEDNERLELPAAAATPSLTFSVSHDTKLKRWVLTELALTRMASYKYMSGSSTPLDRLLNHYWNWVVNFLPLWVAPNLVTLLGLMFMIASATLVVSTNPTFTTPLPLPVSLFCFISLFAYQTLDAIDGKQARRTGSSSPLGQLFDHGCDALNTVFICTILAGAWSLGDHPWLMLNILFNIFFAFFIGQWEEYHTGLMMTSNGYVGVTEGQVVQMAILLFTACFGGETWALILVRLGGVALTLKAVCMTWGTLLTLWVSVSSVLRVLGGDHTRRLLPEEVGEKRVGRREALEHLVSMILSFLLGGMWTVGHGHEVFKEHPAGVLLGLGMSMAYLSTRMTVSHMTKQPFGISEMIVPILPQLLIVVNTYYQQVNSKRSGLLPLSDTTALWLYVSLMVVVYFYYVLGVIADICHFLNIYCLSLPSSTSKKMKRK